jgi:hypothetical protein
MPRSGIGGGTTIKESLLTEIWRQQAMGKATLLTSSGKRINVIHPGRKSNDSGPDFCDALIDVDGERVKGSIEIHVSSRQWQAHGHHKDPGFNDTILHVVMWDDGEGTSLLQSKGRIPILALSPYLHGSTEELGQLVRSSLAPDEPCRKALKRGGRASVLDALNKAGEERFYSKVGKFKAAMTLNQAEQVLYEGMMAALGYAKNKEPFEELARTMSLRLLSKFAVRGAIIEIQASMLGAAGLLPMDFQMGSRETQTSTEGFMEVDRLQQTWSSLKFKETLGKSKWRFFRVRPENSPTRRIIAFSHLLAGCRGELMRSMLIRLAQPTASKAQKDLELGLMVKTDGYWASHFHFGIEAGWRPTLIGRSRARDIIVNVLLPFSFAWSQANSDAWLGNRSRELYLGHPKLQENWITRYMGVQILGVEPEAVASRSACHQQGLIHLYRTYCAEHRCRVCPLA